MEEVRDRKMEVYVLKVFMWYFMNNVTTNERIQEKEAR